MKTFSKIFLSTAAIAFAIIIFANKKKANTQKRVAAIANEGYETAADILDPKSNLSFKKIHLGPVLPHHLF